MLKTVNYFITNLPFNFLTIPLIQVINIIITTIILILTKHFTYKITLTNIIITSFIIIKTII